MKPRFRPGKPAAANRKEREVVAKAKMLSESQLEHLRNESEIGSIGKKTGKGGKRADWDVDYEEERSLRSKPMPYREPEKFTQEGVHRFPKRGGHR